MHQLDYTVVICFALLTLKLVVRLVRYDQEEGKIDYMLTKLNASLKKTYIGTKRSLFANCNRTTGQNVPTL